MKRLLCLACVALVGFFGTLPANAAEMTFQLVNDTERALNLKLFSRGESRQQWPAKTKAYSVRPEAAVQQIKIKCTEGEQICWGAWVTTQTVSGEMTGSGDRVTRTSTVNAGVGERGMHDCPGCCHVCKDGLITPVSALRNSSAQSVGVR